MNIVLAMAQGLVVMLVAPFFSGLARVIRAKMHNRRGPSILQDYRDLAKLMARPESVSSDSSFVLRIMPPLFLAVSFMLAMGLPMFTLESPMPVFGDAITIMYALALSRFFFALSGVDSSNAYAGFGGIRELLMSVLIEPSMLIALFTVAIVCGSTDIATMGQHIVTGNVSSVVAVILAGVAFAAACYMELGKLPFDQAEAEQELQGGPARRALRSVPGHDEARHGHEAGRGRRLVHLHLHPLGRARDHRRHRSRGRRRLPRQVPGRFRRLRRARELRFPFALQGAW